MKKLLIFLSCALIIGIAQLNAMKRDNNHITTTSEIVQVPWLPGEMITKISANCDVKSRANLSVVDNWSNTYASIKNNPSIVDQPEFKIKKKNQLYYLFYGCIHNLKNLVKKTLNHFKYRMFDIDILKSCIKKLTNSDIINSLPDSLVYDEINPLCLAIYSEDEQLFRLLLKQPNIDVDAINSINLYEPDPEVRLSETPLQCLIYKLTVFESHKVKNMIKLLLDHPNINVNKQTEDVYAPLFYAIKAHKQGVQFEEVVKPLLTHNKIEVNAQNDNGDTPLHYAVKKNNLEALKLLLTHSATDITIQNNNKETPLTLAIKTKTEKKTRNFLGYEYLHEINRHAIIAQLLLAEGMINHTQHYTGK